MVLPRDENFNLPTKEQVNIVKSNIRTTYLIIRFRCCTEALCNSSGCSIGTLEEYELKEKKKSDNSMSIEINHNKKNLEFFQCSIRGSSKEWRYSCSSRRDCVFIWNLLCHKMSKIKTVFKLLCFLTRSLSSGYPLLSGNKQRPTWLSALAVYWSSMRHLALEEPLRLKKIIRQEQDQNCLRKI